MNIKKRLPILGNKRAKFFLELTRVYGCFYRHFFAWRPISTLVFSLGLTLTCTGGWATPAHAFEESFQNWNSLTIQGDATPDLQLYIDLNARLYDDLSASTFIVRPALGFRLMDRMYGWLGYAWTPGWTDNGALVREHRLWEQWTYDLPGFPDGFQLFFRSRLEQRFRPGHAQTTAFRFRQLVRLLVPIAWGGALRLSLWDELFVGLSRAEQAVGQLWQRSGLNQNRLFLGPSLNVTADVRLECGYLLQVVFQPQEDTVHHIAALNAFVLIH